MAKDERITANEEEEKGKLNEVDVTYGDMISNSDTYFQDQIKANKDWADKQTDLQNEKTDFTIEQIEQQRGQAKKDYIKEQSGAYVDWQKQSNQYGANAEQKASAGLTNSGYSESSQVSMYNTYQNRVTSAREAFMRASLNYDNAIKEAQLQNSSILAEIAYESLKNQLELSLQGFQYKNTLILEKAKTKREISAEYHDRYVAILNQINTENAQAEAKRQFNENMAFQKEQFAWQKAQAAKASSSISKGSSGGSSSSNSGGSSINKTSSGGSENNKANLRKSAWETLNTGNVYEKAKSFMKEHGISDGGQRLLTSQEWNKAKKIGVLGSELEYKSYNDYVRNYVYWRIDES